MCAIFGLIPYGELQSGWLAAMSRLLRHRGPDDEGFALFDGRVKVQLTGGDDTPEAVFDCKSDYAPRGRIEMASKDGLRLALGHRRLSILDLSPLGHQPMTRDGRFWIVFNGEIFNYIELRDELRGLGVQFRTESDTEVLLAAYERWGTDCLARFNGMWAFAIYDRERGELFLARDRFGVKPLYYWRSPLGLAFSSEVKAFTALPGWSSRLNRARGWDFLALGLSDHTDETLFANVHQLRGGECLSLRLSDLPAAERLPVRRWYELKPDPQAAGLSYAEAAKTVREKLLDAVRLRLRSDVPLGSCLSGGIDSSAIVCCVNHLLPKSSFRSAQHTFTACSHDSAYDERHFAELVADATGAEADFIYPQPEQLFELLERITWHQDEPFNSTSIYAQWALFTAAAGAGIKVMLDGQGGDEVFAGYHMFWNPYFSELFRRGQIVECNREIQAAHRLQGLSVSKAWWHAFTMNAPDWMRRVAYQLGIGSGDIAWLGFKRLDFAAHRRISSVRTKSEILIQISHLPMLLHWEDRDSMAHSIEARTPFLDYRLVEFALGLPASYLIGNGWTKRGLRESLTGILPKPIRLRRDKKAFALPESPWMTGGLQVAFKNRLTAAVQDCGGLLTHQLLEDFEDVVAKRAPYDQKFWRAVSFDVWRRRFKVALD